MALDGVAACDLLDADPEPCFVLDLEQPKATSLVWKNKALAQDDDLLHDINSSDHTSIQFWRWIRGETVDSHLYTFSSKAWMAFTYDKRWSVVRGQPPKVKSKSHGDGGEKYTEETTTSDRDYGDYFSPTNPEGETKESSYSQERLRDHHRLMAMSDVGVFEYDMQGNLIYANEAWYKLSGHPLEEDRHTSFSFMDIVHPEDSELVMAMWQRLIGGTPVNFKMRWKATGNGYEDGPDRDAQWILASCVPIMRDGKVDSIAGNTVNISAQKRSIFEAEQRTQALERARASEARFSRFTAAAPIGIYFYNPDMTPTYCNDQFFKMTGHPVVAYEKLDWPSIVFEDDIPIVEEALRTLIVDRKPTSVQIRLKRTWRSADGIDRVCWMQGDSYPETNEDGELRSIGGTLIDISQVKFSEDLEKTRTVEALEAKRQQENFIDMTSHEMRNPLSAVIQCADSAAASLALIADALEGMAQETNLDLVKARQEVQSSLDAVQTIMACSSHQKRIIDDVLTLSKLDGDLLLITPVRVDPVTVIGDALKMFELECSKLEMKISFIKSPSLQTAGVQSVRLDPSRLVQILINLVTNAIKFTSNRPTRQINVTLGASNDRSDHDWPEIAFTDPPASADKLVNAKEWGTGKRIYLWITVEDTGCGLTPAQQQSLFARFSQATPRTHVRYGGSGLGLFISKSLAEKQGGGVGVRSEAGTGSTFAFYVSARIASTPAYRAKQERPQSPAVQEESLEEKIKAAKYSVLIVEDNIVNRKVLAKQLMRLNCQIHVADHGKAALEFLETTKYWKGKQDTGVDVSVVLLDIEMPIMDGLTCVKEIRRLQSSGDIVAHVPILAVSANARSEQLATALEAGMDDTMTKPFRIGEILPKLHKLAATKQTITGAGV